MHLKSNELNESYVTTMDARSRQSVNYDLDYTGW